MGGRREGQWILDERGVQGRDISNRGVDGGRNGGRGLEMPGRSCIKVLLFGRGSMIASRRAMVGTRGLKRELSDRSH